MSTKLGKAMLVMCLEEEDDPFDLLDRPQYSFSGKNSLSGIGRISNPDSQRMSYVTLDMPRKWQLYDRVKCVALSKEIFNLSLSMNTTLKKS